MKKLTVKKGSECMACLACVQACSNAFYKEFHPDKSCIQIIEKNGAAKPMVCVQCGKCAKACEAGAITQNAKGVYTINKKLCTQCGKCAEACPMGLEPFLLNKLARNGMTEELEDNAVQDCIECGCCLYSCPANIPLLDIIRIAKGEVIRAIRARTAPKK